MKPSELLNFVLQKEKFLKHWSIVHITKDFLILAVCLTSYHPLEETLHRFVIFNYILDYIYSRFNHLLSSWNQDILQPNKLELYCYVIHEKGANVEFVGPKINKNIVYNGQKRVHDIKFQSAALPNGLTSNFSNSYVGKRHDSTMVNEPGLLSNLQRPVLAQQSAPLQLWWSNIPLFHSSWSPFSWQNLTPKPVSYNKARVKL